MIEQIDSHKILKTLLSETCCENGICISFEENIPKDSYRIIKVDKYYNSLNIEKRPASIDCLIIRKCISTGYGITLVELKDISTSKGFTVINIKEKFENTLNDFISSKFKVPLLMNYEDVKLYFVSNKEIHKRDLGLKMELLISLKFKFQDRNYMLQPKMPTPTIKNCYS